MIGGPTHAEGAAAARVLNDEYAGRSLDEEQRRVIEEWQRDDRTYEAFQAIARGESDDLYMVERADILDVLIEQHALKRPVRVYRGVRSATKAFGVDNSTFGQFVGRQIALHGFFATSVFRDVAIEEFTRPALGGGAVLLEVCVSAGVRALWVAAVGRPELAHQGELLLPSMVVLTVVAADDSAEIPTIRVAVAPL